MKTKELTWESECLPHIEYFNPNGDVAICVLWNKLSDVIPCIKPMPDRISMIGNLRTPLGISWLIRGLWKYPQVKTVVLWGSDYTKTGKALLNLSRLSLKKCHAVPEFNWPLDTSIPLEDIDELFWKVNFFNAIGYDIDMLSCLIGDRYFISNKQEHNKKDFPPMVVNIPDSLPYLGSGISLVANSPGEAWLKIINAVMRYGNIKGTRKEETLRHVFDIKVTFPVRVVDDCKPFGISLDEFHSYYDNFMLAGPPDLGIDYRYGHRMQDWRGVNQLKEITSKLQEKPDTKRATISLLDATDHIELEDMPCYVTATYSITDNQLNSAHVFRSHDMFSGWPMNVLAIQRLHRDIAQHLGTGLGNISITSHNAQIYERNWTQAEEKIKTWQEQMPFCDGYKFKNDICGNFIFSLVDRDVRVQMTNPNGDMVIYEQVDTDPFRLVHQLVEIMPALDKHHLIYLTREARKLSDSLKTGCEYIQD